MTKLVKVKSQAEVEAERERRQQVLAEVRRLSGVVLEDRPWRYDYSVDEVLAAVRGAGSRGQGSQ